MLSVKRIKELLNDQNISDKEAEEIRDSFRIVAEIIFEKWQKEKKQKEKKIESNQKIYPQSYVLFKK